MSPERKRVGARCSPTTSVVELRTRSLALGAHWRRGQWDVGVFGGDVVLPEEIGAKVGYGE